MRSSPFRYSIGLNFVCTNPAKAHNKPDGPIDWTDALAFEQFGAQRADCNAECSDSPNLFVRRVIPTLDRVEEARGFSKGYLQLHLHAVYAAVGEIAIQKAEWPAYDPQR
jgi:hypothetical protein